MRRGVKVTNVIPGREPAVEFEADGSKQTLGARLIVGADGRNSMVRKWGRFEVTETEPQQVLAGVLFENSSQADTDNIAVFNPFMTQIAFIFPQSNGTCARLLRLPHDGQARASRATATSRS